MISNYSDATNTCGNSCNCPTGECPRYSTVNAHGSASSNVWFYTVPPESEHQRELRELKEALEAAFIDRSRKTRAGWAHALRQRQKPAHRPPRVPKDFQRRPGRPSRRLGRGGPLPLRGSDK